MPWIHREFLLDKAQCLAEAAKTGCQQAEGLTVALWNYTSVTGQRQCEDFLLIAVNRARGAQTIPPALAPAVTHAACSPTYFFADFLRFFRAFLEGGIGYSPSRS